VIDCLLEAALQLARLDFLEIESRRRKRLARGLSVSARGIEEGLELLNRAITAF
jgi:hypothetical protein